MVLSACVAASPAAPALAAPVVAQTAADRARVESAVEKFEAARQRSEEIDARVAGDSAKLDRLMADERAAHKRIAARAYTVYRLGEDSYLTILLGAESLEDLNMRWEALLRMSEQDAENVRALETAQAAIRRSAGSLLELQAEQARAEEAADAELAAARRTLADSEQALKAYEARVAKAKAARKAVARRGGGPDQSLTGKGVWSTGLASHYSKNFNGRGASGAPITPYSMMVAHKTLPFHTLVEIEYNGKRAVASVEDRGPHSGARVFDLGPGVVRVLGFSGVHPVRYRIISRP